MARLIRLLTTPELGPAGVQLREMFAAAWAGPDDGFSDDDWEHATGGTHVMLVADGVVVSHASVVERVLETNGRALRTGYVEAVATWPELQGRGHATEVMNAVGSLIDDRFELGALGTGRHGFYGRLGWERWRGPTAVRTERGAVRTPEEDGFVMVRRTPTTPRLDLEAQITCDRRPGDVW
jgi:aminoglycoside 2'-N-acetyltransferase I